MVLFSIPAGLEAIKMCTLGFSWVLRFAMLSSVQSDKNYDFYEINYYVHFF
jgi:hypothetical protein